MAGSAVATLLARHRLRRLDTAWLVRRLDADHPALQDSADLLLRDADTLGPLQRLQHQRLADHLATSKAPDLRRPWPRRALAAAWLVAIAAVAVTLAWPTATSLPTTPPVVTSAPADTAPTHTTLSDVVLRIAPPAYTGLPPRDEPGGDARAPVGSTLRWSLRLQPAPESASLRLHDGRVLPLQRDGDTWSTTHVLDGSVLVRLDVTGLPLRDATAWRIDAVPDQPPLLRVITPERSLTLRTDGQRQWPLRFEASDDHGLGAARLVVTLAQGSGEQVTVTARTLALRGTGSATQRQYTHTLDLAALGMAEGDDLIVRLEVDDNHQPSPQRSRGASLILRWPPPPAAEASGMDGLVQRALPAYFRSQRQIIIDAEALLAERPRLAQEKFASRSDGLGVDQRILRMRYGQFLGEENEGGPEPPPGGDEDGHADDDGHAHGDAPEERPALGGAVDALSEYGHTHDDAAAATLLDPETRALLKQALDAMWQSERELRLARPQAALPHAYRALAYIKQVQQATRIYLARTGLELPPIDEARRMSGKRDGISSRRDGLVPADAGDSPALALWQALAGDGDTTAEMAAFSRWLDTHGDEVGDRLDVLAAIDTLAATPGCADCRARLRDRLWPLLPAQVPGTTAREAPDAEGRAWLDALRTEDTP